MIMGDFNGTHSDEEGSIDVQLPDTTEPPQTPLSMIPGHLPWHMSEAEMIKIAQQDEQDLIKLSGKSIL